MPRWYLVRWQLSVNTKILVESSPALLRPQIHYLSPSEIAAHLGQRDGEILEDLARSRLYLDVTPSAGTMEMAETINRRCETSTDPTQIAATLELPPISTSQNGNEFSRMWARNHRKPTSSRPVLLVVRIGRWHGTTHHGGGARRLRADPVRGFHVSGGGVRRLQPHPTSPEQPRLVLMEDRRYPHPSRPGGHPCVLWDHDFGPVGPVKHLPPALVNGIVRHPMQVRQLAATGDLQFVPNPQICKITFVGAPMRPQPVETALDVHNFNSKVAVEGEINLRVLVRPIILAVLNTGDPESATSALLCNPYLLA